MAALDFPASPTVGQTYSANGTTYRWDGTAWVGGNILTPAGGGTGTATAFTAGSVVFAGPSGVYTQDNPNLSFDDANNQLNVAGITIGRGGGASATNTLVGNSSFTNNTTGTSNVVVGYGAGNTPYTATTTSVVVGAGAGAGLGGNDTVVGANALSTANAGGYWNTAIGAYSLRDLTSGTNNTAVGVYAAYKITTGGSNAALGHNAMPLTTTGNNNVALGYNTLASNVSGGDNVAIGRSAGSGITGSNQIAIGRDSGASDGFTLAIGAFAASGVNTGYGNMAIGQYSMSGSGSGAENVAVGDQALRVLTNGNNNTAVGGSSLYANTTGGQNTALGHGALYTASTADRNTAVGHSALYDATTGGYNTVVGYNTGRGITTGTGNTIIGAQVTGLSSSLTNHILIANGVGSVCIVVDNTGKVGIGSNVSPTAAIDTDGDTVRVRTSRTPASASATGNAGDICWDSSYIYVCTATNTWKRSAIATW